MLDPFWRQKVFFSPASRWGLLIFAFGVFMLIGVFVTSFQFLKDANVKLTTIDKSELAALQPVLSRFSTVAYETYNALTRAYQGRLQAFTEFFITNTFRLGLLLFMGYIASQIAGKGLALHSRASRGEQRE